MPGRGQMFATSLKPFCMGVQRLNGHCQIKTVKKWEQGIYGKYSSEQTK